MVQCIQCASQFVRLDSLISRNYCNYTTHIINSME